MIELNLLPPQEKEFLGLEQNRRWVIFYGANFLLIILSFIVLLGLIWFFILIQLKSYSQSLAAIETSFEGQSIDRQKELVTNLNQYLAKLNSAQEKHQRYSPVLAELANLIPAGVRIESLSIDKDNQINLAGWAAQRTQVLALQDALEKSTFFSNIEKPLTNLTKPVNINFNFKFSLRPLNND